MRYSLGHIPAGEAGTDQTVSKLAELVKDALKRPKVRLQAIRILERANVPNKNQLHAAAAIWRWVRDHVRYIPDPVDVETIQDPEITLTLRAGDCDDHTALVAALAQSIGIPVRLRVVGQSPDRFEHIFGELFVNGKWMPADTTHSKAFGKRAGPFKAEKVYNRNGVGTMHLGQPERTNLLTTDQIAFVSYEATVDVLKRNWENGLINRADVAGYLRVIDEGNSPSRGTPAEPGIRKAIVNFLKHVDGYRLVSSKPAGLNGLEGLGGFLGSIWKGVKKAVGFVGKAITGGGGETIVNVPPVNVKLPDGLIQTNVPRGSFAEGASAFMSSPAVWVGLGLVALLVLRPMLAGVGGRRR